MIFKTGAGNEPVRDWLKNLPNEKKIHRGTDFRDFLREQGLLDEVEERAMKQALALQLAQLLKENELTKADMAVRMKTSRAAVDRLPNVDNPSITLTKLGKSARAPGRKIKIEFVPAQVMH